MKLQQRIESGGVATNECGSFDIQVVASGIYFYHDHPTPGYGVFATDRRTGQTTHLCDWTELSDVEWFLARQRNVVPTDLLDQDAWM